MTDAESIARLIAGDEPPSWLTPAMEKLRATLHWTVRKESEYPTRQGLRKRLKILADAIDLVRGSLRDFPISTLLLSGEDCFEHQNEMDHALHHYAAMVSRTLNEIPSGPGRNKYYARADGLSCAVNCALMVCMAWKRVNGKLPPNNNNTAHRACAALWAAAGGRMNGLWGRTRERTSVVIWRDHIRDAKKSIRSLEAEFINRNLDAIPGG